MDIILTIFYATIILGILVFVHEGGHYLASRAFGVRVTEFMIGLPGPSIGFKWRGTRFGVTAVPLGGYAKVCGMEAGEQSPYLEKVLALVYAQGSVIMEDVAQSLEISDDDAYEALEELTEWGSIVGPTKKDQFNVYRTPELKGAYELGQPREIENAHALYESEYKQQYRSLPFWKRSIILLAGIIMNLLFAILLMVLAFSVVGLDMLNSAGELVHVTFEPWEAVTIGFNYIAMVVQAVAGLFNPATAGETISQSTSIVGIAYYSSEWAGLGFGHFLWFMSMISVSLGIMNLLPIPPLDGGRFVIEVFQKISRKTVTQKIMNYMSAVGLVLFMGLFVVLLNQDIQRIISGTM